MNWLTDNPVGQILASISGFFVLIALGIAIAWTGPVAVEVSDTDTGQSGDADKTLRARQIAGVKELQVINTRPVFNETRLPVVIEVEDDSSGAEEDASIAVADAPDVRLTGIIITPDMKIATLTPADEQLENVMAYEGESLVGEYTGWKVGQVNPRTVVLNSNNGQQLELDLQVHDKTIKEPPKPARVAEDAAPVDDESVSEEGRPLTRAEQIRQRIAERREELRIEQEQKQAQDRAGGSPPISGSSYQNAMREMLQNRPKSPSSADKNDG